jgi:protein-L-isoaspartate(D-aspartate) O-methyltransferase
VQRQELQVWRFVFCWKGAMVLPVLLAAFACNMSGCNREADAGTSEHHAAMKPIDLTVKFDDAQPWTPPRPAERQDERDALAKYLHDNYGLDDNETLASLREVPRHEFVPAELAAHAYDDTPLPIAYGQLISQPWIVALMTHELHLKPDAKVLEIGTGSGYQAAVLTHFTKKVFTIEIIKPMAEAAAERLKRVGYAPVQLRIADGFNGWPEEAPFDAIIVTCAAGQIPPPLIKQLAPGGRMMIPVGQPFATQSLMRVVKDENGSVTTESILPVRFVPLTDKDISAPGK